MQLIFFPPKSDIRPFSTDKEHILQYTGFSNVRPAPPAWSRDLFWEWLSVTEWRWPPPLQYRDVGFLKAQFGATQTLPYGQRCYVTARAGLLRHELAYSVCYYLKSWIPTGHAAHT
jgi:hypothetical protein